MSKNNNFYLKIGITIILAVYLISNVSVLIYINNNVPYDEPKLIVKGEVLDMSYFNMTYHNPYHNIIDDLNINVTRHFYNLTIFNQLTQSIVFHSFEISIIYHYNIIIGVIIEIYDFKPFIEIKVY